MSEVDPAVILQDVVEQSAHRGRAVGIIVASAATAAGGAYLNSRGLDLHDKLVPKPEANPSDTFIQLFDALGTVAPGATAVLLVGDVANSVRTNFSKSRSALRDMSDQELSDGSMKSHWGFADRLKHRVARDGRIIAKLALAGGLTAGFYNTAVELGDSQSRVVEAFSSTLGVDGQKTSILAQSDEASQANASDLNKEKSEALIEALHTKGTKAFAVRQDYHTASTASKKAQAIVYGAPQEITQLPLADNCADVQVLVDKSLGAKTGDVITVEGLPVKVATPIEGAAGMNLVPVILNNEDFAMCLQGNEDSPYTLIIAETDPEQLAAVAAQVGFTPDGAEGRATAMTLKAYLKNTEKIGDDSGKPLVLTVIALFDAYTLMAVAGDERFRGEKARKVIATLKSQHFTNKEIAAVQSLRASRLALTAAGLSGGVALAYDYLTNSSIVGASEGTSLTSASVGAAFVIGGSKIASRMATRRQLSKMNVTEELKQ